VQQAQALPNHVCAEEGFRALHAAPPTDLANFPHCTVVTVQHGFPPHSPIKRPLRRHSEPIAVGRLRRGCYSALRGGCDPNPCTYLGLLLYPLPGVCLR